MKRQKHYSKRVAFCVSGMLRNFDIAKPSYLHLVKLLNDKGFEVDFFLSFWDTAIFTDVQHESYVREIDEDHVRHAFRDFNICGIAIHSSESVGIVNGSTISKSAFMLSRCNHLKSKYESEENFYYEYVFGSRPDIYVTNSFCDIMNEFIDDDQYGLERNGFTTEERQLFQGHRHELAIILDNRAVETFVDFAGDIVNDISFFSSNVGADIYTRMYDMFFNEHTITNNPYQLPHVTNSMIFKRSPLRLFSTNEGNNFGYLYLGTRCIILRPYVRDLKNKLYEPRGDNDDLVIQSIKDKIVLWDTHYQHNVCTHVYDSIKDDG